jgi:phenylacetate-CoA ligase
MFLDKYKFRVLLFSIFGKISNNDVVGELNKLNEDILKNQNNELYNLEKLRNLLQYAKLNSSYYKRILVNLDLANLNYVDFSKLPILDKRILSENINDILTISKSKLIKNSSSGSTGYRTDVYWTKKEQNINRATQLLWWNWAGYNLGQPILQTGITPNRGFIKRIKDWLLNTYYLSAFSHDQSQVQKAMNWVKMQKNPVFLGGYASSLFSIAKLSNGTFANFSSAVSWGDKLFSHYSTKIKDSFNCAVYETYGSAEGLMIGAQKDLKYMYIMASNVYLEIVDDNDQPVQDGELGHVIVTNLNGYGTPLIRYRIGDLAIKLPMSLYPEVREFNMPLLMKVIGRDTDIIRTPNGKLIVVHAFTGIFEHFEEIKQFCVIQNIINEIEIQYIENTNFQDFTLDLIRTKLLKIIDEDFIIKFIKVNEILPTKSGKPQLIVSNIKINP